MIGCMARLWKVPPILSAWMGALLKKVYCQSTKYKADSQLQTEDKKIKLNERNFRL